MLDRLTIERMTALAGEGPILVALSGGGDSVALLRLLATALGASRLRAAIVDHALRQGSDTDARRALGFADAVGVTGDILTLTWPAGVRRAQAAARAMRATLRSAHAPAISARVIAVAHSADDQAETVLMRAAGGSLARAREHGNDRAEALARGSRSRAGASAARRSPRRAAALSACAERGLDRRSASTGTRSSASASARGSRSWRRAVSIRCASPTLPPACARTPGDPRRPGSWC
ncbi:MAG: ATP-binding protein [Hyphomonadaceae bacterium]